MEAAASFGAYVHKRRKALDMTQEELARCVGCSASAIRKIESGHRRPSRQVAELLAGCLQIPPGERERFIRVARFERSAEALPVLGVEAFPGAPGVPLPGRVAPARPEQAGLPAPLTRLVGRDPELSQLTRLLLQPDCQLVTLLGPAGIGKTRLALQVAQDFLDDPASPFPDGVYLASLAPLDSPDFLLPALAGALGFQFHGPGDEKNQLLGYLRRRRMLLVVDNVEHLLPGVALLLEVLQQAPATKILATSRERLNLPGEWVFEIQGLPAPPPGLEQGLENYSAAALFLQSARRARPDFTLNEQNRAAIARICRLVEGTPLALELAAAWVRALSPDEIAVEIERSLDFLSTPARSIPERHRSLRAAFDHSWNLLSPEERYMVRRLSVFQGGFSRQAAEWVAGATPAGLLSLVDQSILARGENGRYGMHDLIRQYAALHLEKDQDEQASTRDRHMDYFIGFLAARGQNLKSHRQKEALAELSAEINNLRLAWDRAIEKYRLEHLRSATQPLLLYFELRNLFQEAEAIFSRALDDLERAEDPPDVEKEITRGMLQSGLAWFSYRSGRTEQALALSRFALSLLRRNEAQAALADALWVHSSACWFAGAFAEASHSISEGLALYRRLGQTWGIANLTIYQGILHQEQGNLPEAHRLLQEGLDLARSTGDPRMISFAANFLSRTPQAIQNYAHTRALLQEVLQLAIDTGDRYGQGIALERLALLAGARGEFQEACACIQESLALYREIGDLWSLSRALNQDAWFHLRQDGVQDALDLFKEALKTAEEARVLPNALIAMGGLAQVWARLGDVEASCLLAQHVAQNPASPSEAAQEARQLLESLAGKLPAQRQTELQAHARTSTFDQLAAIVLRK